MKEFHGASIARALREGWIPVATTPMGGVLMKKGVKG